MPYGSVENEHVQTQMIYSLGKQDIENLNYYGHEICGTGFYRFLEEVEGGSEYSHSSHQYPYDLENIFIMHQIWFYTGIVERIN